MPKIKLLFDLRKPCSDKTLAARNANVLREAKDIPRGTDFVQQLEMFRTERANCLEGEVKLYIPGKIVHLVQVDTKDDDNDHGKYVPYWASRHDFKLVISNRMTADHSMLDLVEILNNIRLDEDDNKSFGRSSIIASTLINSMNIGKGDDSEDNGGTDVRLFMCCSNPKERFQYSYPLVVLLLWFCHLGP